MSHQDIRRASKKRARQARAAKKKKDTHRKNARKWEDFGELLTRFYGGDYLSKRQLKKVL